MKKIQKFLVATSILFLLKSFVSFFCYRYLLFMPFDTALVTAAVPLILGVIGLVYKEKITQFLQNEVLSDANKQHRLYYWLTAIAFVGFYFTIITTFLLSYTVLWQDEWRHFNDYLFKKDTYHSIFDRQNGHLMIIPNAIFLANMHLLTAKEIWLILLNNITLLFITAVLIRNLYHTLKGQIKPIANIASCAILALSVFWLAGDVTLFWGIGIHNNLAALGTTFAAYSLSRQEKIGPYKGMLYFVIGAMLSSCCFGAGSATWVLGFVAAILLRQNFKFVLSHLVIGLLGGFLTIGYYTLSRGGGIIKFEIIPFIQSIPAFLGACFTQMLNGFLAASMINIISITLGLIGLLLLGIKAFSFWKDTSKAVEFRFYKKPAGMLFPLLLAFFGVACGVLVGLGRVKGDLTHALDGRYHSWSVIFWGGLLATSIIFISHLQKSKLQEKMLAGFLSFALFSFLFFNLAKIDLRLEVNNAVISYQTDLVVHPDTKGKEKFLWQGNLDIPRFRKIVVKVADYLKTEQKNLYTQAWTHWMEKDFATEFTVEKPTPLGSQLQFSIDAATKDILLKGWVFPNSTFQLAPANLVVVYKGKIVGVGTPYSDRNETPPAINPSISNAFNLLPRPFGIFPGLSNYYYAQVNPELLNQGTFDEKSVRIYGVYLDNSYVQLQ
ncbi:MAG: hypothetical protein AB8G86_01145 [Saprospiraceae bacterium]